MVYINLIRNTGFSWFTNGNIFVKGYLFDEKNEFYRDQALIDYFATCYTKDDVLSKLKNSNGLFSVVILRENNLLATAGINRHFPLFYTTKESDFYISDDPEYLLNKFDKPEIDEFSKLEFRATGFITDNRTLIDSVFQINSASLLSNQDKQIESKYYYYYTSDVLFKDDYNLLKNNAENVIYNALNRLVKSLNGQTVMVSLSGGYDSRLIVAMLKKLNYKNVICYTYGKSGNPEMIISEKVAKILGYKWLFIEYTDLLQSNYINDPVFDSYYKYASSYSSMFMMMDFFALKHFKNNRLIPEDAVFIQGHLGDFLGGSQLTKYNILHDISIDDAANIVLKLRHIYYPLNNEEKKQLRNEIKQQILATKSQNQQCINYTLIEDWDLKERLAKFISNSSSVFHYFGYEIRMPLWDIELLNFFKNVPLEFKKNKRLYIDLLCSRIFKPLNISFSNEMQSTPLLIKIQHLKDLIRNLIPFGLKYLFQNPPDYFRYTELSKDMVAEMNKSDVKVYSKHKLVNSYLIQWYAYRITTQLNQIKSKIIK